MSTTGGRLGPRPISLHMAMVMWNWNGSLAALPLVQNGSMQWMPKLAAEAARLTQALREAETPVLAAAVEGEVAARTATLVGAIDSYRAHPYSRDVVNSAATSAFGTAALRDYGGDGLPRLFVPSLVNRAYILDLSQRLSLLRWLSARGVHPYLLDWGTPGADEKAFSITDYTDGPRRASLAALCNRHGGPVHLVGYCMGGNIALAVALKYPDYVGSLTLLATPWNFHAERGSATGLLSPGGPVEQTIAAMACCQWICCKQCLSPSIRCSRRASSKRLLPSRRMTRPARILPPSRTG
jgi:polyhydroxyalkanoate synthase